MKKIIKVLFVMLFMFTIVGCKGNNIHSISYESFKEKIDKKESLILYFGSSDTMETTLNNVLNKYDLKAYEIKTSNLSDSDINSLKEIIDYDEPSICFIIDGVNPTKLINITDEYIIESKLETTLKTLNFIK